MKFLFTGTFCMYILKKKVTLCYSSKESRITGIGESAAK